MDFVSFWRTCERMNFVSFGVTVNVWVSSRQFLAYAVNVWNSSVNFWISTVLGVPVNVCGFVVSF